MNSHSPFSSKNKRVFVTGAAGLGVGNGVCQAADEAGGSLVISSTKLERSQRAAQQYRDAFATESDRQDRIPKSRTNQPTFPWAEGDMLRGAETAYFHDLKTMVPNGLYGEPWAANCELGKQLINVVSERFASILDDLLLQRT
ncbi:hypothetical protein [Rubellicoccus peritrichatus]|uniref:Uncharacterized protein n=1 Tax=Rubellicoccus peritrichatus TaxID=3080537 RepID=A0AAQ3L814_9BACT|nr:hypothetical protein [Puniceicoccus sp. CR14]WOO40631.1 hypothetical protein RZN69_18570 [Puniceicoccus sp. CR14]